MPALRINSILEPARTALRLGAQALRVFIVSGPSRGARSGLKTIYEVGNRKSVHNLFIKRCIPM